MRLSTYGKPRVIACAEQHGRHVGLPRGCVEDVQTLLRDLGVTATLRDEREQGTPLGVTFSGALRPEQQKAANALMKHDSGRRARSMLLSSRVSSERASSTIASQPTVTWSSTSAITCQREASSRW